MTRLLRDDIVLGRRKPGARLVEREIAAELDVSRLPVREAIRALISEGIVVGRPRTWAVVRKFSVSDVRDFSEVRAAVESLLFVLATERHDERQLAELLLLVEEEEEAARNSETERAQRLSGAFHEQIAVMAGNDLLMELISLFSTRLKWVFGTTEDAPSMAADHRQLYEAMAVRDIGRVEGLVAEHLVIGEERARRLFEGPGSMTETPTG